MTLRFQTPLQARATALTICRAPNSACDSIAYTNLLTECCSVEIDVRYYILFIYISGN